jgi:RNA polymerase sigma-70 factor (ECF subfamily)
MQPAKEQIIDQILVMDAQDGDAEAMEKLVSRWLGIIKGLRKLNDPASFKAWAYRITTNKSFDWIRKRKAGKHISIEEIQDHQHKEKEDTGVKELLEKLDARKRAVLSLYYFEQLSVPEISVALNISAGTVKSRLFKAREELKKLWQKYSED